MSDSDIIRINKPSDTRSITFKMSLDALRIKMSSGTIQIKMPSDFILIDMSSQRPSYVSKKPGLSVGHCTNKTERQKDRSLAKRKLLQSSEPLKPKKSRQFLNEQRPSKTAFSDILDKQPPSQTTPYLKEGPAYAAGSVGASVPTKPKKTRQFLDEQRPSWTTTDLNEGPAYAAGSVRVSVPTKPKKTRQFLDDHRSSWTTAPTDLREGPAYAAGSLGASVPTKPKKPRHILNEQQPSKEASSGLHRGPTYDAGKAQCSTEATEIPDPVSPPQQLPVRGKHNLVYFDLETTRFGTTADLTQIAACCDSSTYNSYMKPSQSIDPQASLVTGLTYDGQQLCKNGHRVTAYDPEDTLEDFIQYLKSFSPCVLVAHNGHTFDARILLNQLSRFNLLDEFKAVCSGISDSKVALRLVEAGRVQAKLSFTQVSLCKDLLDLEYEAHNAIEDVNALQKLCSLRLQHNHLMQSSLTVDTIVKNMKFAGEINKNRATFADMVSAKAMSAGMATKCAKSGLRMEHFKLAYSRGGDMGLLNLMCEEIDGKARVTKQKRIIQSISQYIS